MRALAAVSAVGLSLASMASAESTEFTASSYPVTYIGESTSAHAFEVGEIEVSCEAASFAGEAEGPSESILLYPTYKECEWLLGTATVETNGCGFVFHAPDSESEEGAKDIVCSEGQTIVIGVLGCDIYIGPQNGLLHVTYTNTGEDIDQHETVTSMHAEIVRTNILCPLESSTVATAGYSGDTTLQGAATSIDFGP